MSADQGRSQSFCMCACHGLGYGVCTCACSRATTAGPALAGRRQTCGAFGCEGQAVVHGIRGEEWVPGDYCAVHGRNVGPWGRSQRLRPPVVRLRIVRGRAWWQHRWPAEGRWGWLR